MAESLLGWVVLEQVRQATEAQTEAAVLAQALRARDAAAEEERVRRGDAEARDLAARREAAAALAEAQGGMLQLFSRGLGDATDGFLAALRAHAPPTPPAEAPPGTRRRQTCWRKCERSIVSS